MLKSVQMQKLDVALEYLVPLCLFFFLFFLKENYACVLISQIFFMVSSPKGNFK